MCKWEISLAVSDCIFLKTQGIHWDSCVFLYLVPTPLFPCPSLMAFFERLPDQMGPFHCRLLYRQQKWMIQCVFLYHPFHPNQDHQGSQQLKTETSMKNIGQELLKVHRLNRVYGWWWKIAVEVERLISLGKEFYSLGTTTEKRPQKAEAPEGGPQKMTVMVR